MSNDALNIPVAITSWTAYTALFGGYDANLNLPFAVRGFFENGGNLAYVVPIKDTTGLPAALDRLTRRPDVSVVATPGVVDPALQATVITQCENMGDRFAILDGALQKQRAGLLSKNGRRECDKMGKLWTPPTEPAR